MEKVNAHKYILPVLFFCLCIIILSWTLSDRKQNTAQRIIGKTSQNINDYIKSDNINTELIDSAKQKQLSENYLDHFFSPWTNQHRLYDNNTIKNLEISYINQFKKNPGFGENKQAYDSLWIEKIKDNMNSDSFGLHEQKAIVTEASDLRVLPTTDPSYSSLTKAGQYYPFDNLQESYVAVGTPALILQSSKDGAWDLIYINNGFGWISHQHIAYSDDKFIQQYQSFPESVITADNTPINDQNKFAFFGRLGSLYPVPKNTTASMLYIPLRDIHQQAVMILANTDQSKINLFPVVLNLKNISQLSQQLIGQPYGWGGLYGYRDCSATVMDLLAPFGIWLPRNSSNQIKIGNYISMENLSRKEKEKTITQQAVPFLTLIGLPGHIMLYIGTYHDKIYVLQNIWGLHTGLLVEGRAVIGQTVITPLDFDRHYINIPTPLIDKINAMSVL